MFKDKAANRHENKDDNETIETNKAQIKIENVNENADIYSSSYSMLPPFYNKIFPHFHDSNKQEEDKSNNEQDKNLNEKDSSMTALPKFYNKTAFPYFQQARAPTFNNLDIQENYNEKFSTSMGYLRTESSFLDVNSNPATEIEVNKQGSSMPSLPQQQTTNNSSNITQVPMFYTKFFPYFDKHLKQT